jgi:hypothetical protein
MNKAIFAAAPVAIAVLWGLMQAERASGEPLPSYYVKEINQGIKARVEKESERAAAFKKQWEAAAPQREAREREQEARRKERAERGEVALTTKSSGLSIPSPQPIRFSGTPIGDFLKASAILDSIRITGRDCEWALKVDEKKIFACIEFLPKLQPGGDYEQAVNKISEVIHDHAFFEANEAELRAVIRIVTDIVKYKEFALARLGVR